MKTENDLERQVSESPKEILSKLEAALGVKGKSKILELLKADPEARRIASKIIGSASPAALKQALNPEAPERPQQTEKPKIEF